MISASTIRSWCRFLFDVVVSSALMAFAASWIWPHPGELVWGPVVVLLSTVVSRLRVLGRIGS